MNYKHIYHAGNFADLAKHTALLYCLDALKRKDAPFFALDTHAGRGTYDLHAPEAHKSQEAARGVQQLLAKAAAAECLGSFFGAQKVRPGKRLAHYTGSPLLIAAALRSTDRGVFVELVPTEARSIERSLESVGRTEVRIDDGYAALKALLPPPERRGLVLIDPPYESVEEFKALLQAFTEAYRRWPTGTYLLWYPLRNAPQRELVHQRFLALRVPKMLCAELALFPLDAGIGLAGSGLVLVNPPFGADEYLKAVYSTIHEALAAPGAGFVEVWRLTPERVAQ
jgi:23S rRNA (adenine2030-N6)-methyltransferase